MLFRGMEEISIIEFIVILIIKVLFVTLLNFKEKNGLVVILLAICVCNTTFFGLTIIK